MLSDAESDCLFKRIEREVLELPCLDSGEAEMDEARSVQCGDVTPTGREHAPHLMIASLRQNESGLTSCQPFKARRKTRFVLSLKSHGSGRKQIDLQQKQEASKQKPKIT